MRLIVDSQTDAGTVRNQNEDAIAHDERLGITVLADGMGGHKAGEVASQFVVDQMFLRLSQLAEKSAEVNDIESIREAIKLDLSDINTLLWAQSNSSELRKGMGSTVVVTFFAAAHLVIAHVGDSRVYLLRKGVVSQLTKDHSFVQMQLDHDLITPEEAAGSGMRNYLLRSMGHNEKLEPTIQAVEIELEDFFVCCSDGLFEGPNQERVPNWLSNACNMDKPSQYLVDQAKDAGSRDNISVITLKVLPSLDRIDGNLV